MTSIPLKNSYQKRQIIPLEPQDQGGTGLVVDHSIVEAG